MVGVVVITALFNWLYSRKFVVFSFKGITFQPFLKSFFTIGFYLILTSMYTSFNVAYLGFVAGKQEVGYYTTAIKLYTILLSFFTAFTAVMLPRMSSLVSEGKIDEVKRLATKVYDGLIAFCVPLIILAFIFAPQIISVLAGPGYEGAILPMRIIMPLILIIGIEQVLVLQILMPLKMDKKILINSIFGACIGIALNILLVKWLQSTGSAIVWLCSELVVLVIAQYFVTKVINIHFPYKKILINTLYSLPILIMSICIVKFVLLGDILVLILAFSLSTLYFGVVQIFWIKNELVLGVLNKLSWIKTRNN